MTVIPNNAAITAPPLTVWRSAKGAEIDLSVPRQILGNWCWAAATRGLEAAFGVQPVREQCEIVTDVLGTGPCCPNRRDVQRCNVPHPPQPALGEIFDRRVNAPYGTSLQFVQDEIVGGGVPILANLGFSHLRFGHVVVISGFRRAGSAVRLIVWDPYTGLRSEEPLRQFQEAFRDLGKWRASYKLKRPAPLNPQ